MVGEREGCVDTAIVQSAISQCLVHVKIHSSTVAVMQNEVPGSVARPWVDPIDSLVGERCDKTFEVVRTYPHVEIGMLPSLLARQRVDRPTSADARFDSVLLQGGRQCADCFRRHGVLGHVLRVPGEGNA